MVYGKNNWRKIEQGEENGYLFTNGLGGFSSLSMIGSNARNDHALLIAALQAPSRRYHLITNIHACVEIGEERWNFASQRYLQENISEISEINEIGGIKECIYNKNGFRYLQCFAMEFLPEWQYHIEDVDVIQTVWMRQGENTLIVQYEVRSGRSGCLSLTPWMQFVPKGERLSKQQKFEIEKNRICSNGISLYYQTNGEVVAQETEFLEGWYYEKDRRDGRDFIGCTAKNHRVLCPFSPGMQMFYLVYSLEKLDLIDCNWVLAEKEKEIQRQKKLVELAGFKNPAAQVLVRSANQFLTWRESTKSQSIIAGYPFFGDWGRDTMVAMIGCTLSTKQYPSARSILRTFLAYCRRGLMPNMFPEDGTEPIYNTVDASLLFFEVFYRYYLATSDQELLKEAWPVLFDIIEWYKKGTDFQIGMDIDGLITAGGGFDQLTWMDVRIGEILPTPRHGKPVEVNAYWYNALCIMAELSDLVGTGERNYFEEMAEKAKVHFLELFWDQKRGYLRDVVSKTAESKADWQIRCNQIWTLTLSYSMLNREQAKSIIQTVYRHLYTPWGLRSLSPKDQEYHSTYGGTQAERDLAYHQGTVWAYPLGAYYLALLRWEEETEQTISWVKRQLLAIDACLYEGCSGQIAEIYDGECPDTTRGCFAQAWSVGEILRVYEEIERIERMEQIE